MAKGDPGDWIELYNAGDAPVDLAGWQLAEGDSAGLDIGTGTMLPGELRLVDAKLDSDGVVLTLLGPDGAEADRLDVPKLAENESYGLDEPYTEQVLLGAGSPGRFTGAPPSEFGAATYEDSGWTPVVLPVGFDRTVTGGEPGERAIERPATQSSDYPGFTGAMAVDGDPSTFSHTNTGDLDPWWQVELDADYAISEIQLVNRYSCCAERLYNVVVQVLDASGSEVWESAVLNPVAEGETPTAPDQVTTLPVEGTPIGRFVRLQKTAVNGSGSSEWLSLAEVAVTGAVVAPYSNVIATDVTAWMSGSTAGLRVPFTLDSGAPTRVVLAIQYDDAFTATIDEAVAEGNVGAPEAHEATAVESFTLNLQSFAAGEHILAVLGENVTADDEDFLLAPTLTAQWFTPGEAGYFSVPTPGEPNGAAGNGPLDPPTFAPPRGFYDAEQHVTITAPVGATLWYTTDGTLPGEGNGTEVAPASASSAASVEIDVPTTAYLRAVATRAGWNDSLAETHTYLFLDDVLAQPSAPAGFPTVWNSQSEGAYTADYEMDPEIAEDPAIRAELLEGLRSIPTLSIVTGIDDLFGDDGFYTNSASRGDEWERRVSLEWIEPDGSTGFQQDAKLQVHGYGWRYHSSTLKHSFRVQFQAEYGASKLEWPLFTDSSAERFDSIVLRAGGSKTWLDFRDPAQAQYLHDAFARDTARDMGKLDGHATYVHLYLDGLYWGLYMPVERPDAGFAEEYLGGTDEEYDAVNRRVTTNEAIDGDLDAYNTMIALADADLSDDDAVTALSEYLDIDDLIDWMLIHQYTTNRDGPCCFEGNNQRGVRKREAGAGYRFFVWDMEYSLWDAADTTNVDVDVAGHASHAYHRLWDNDAFRARYSARAHEVLTGNGALTPAVASARYAARADEVWSALLGESARWGDTYRTQPYTRDVEWMDEYTRLQDEYFPYRTQYMIDQLKAVGLYEE
ncbi:hypothetical protein LBMAG42_46680 [Deltaproteobacteria bacterium]|nr:hypothetical protein LBMAG42_46680 [Deltaproteobacteria bacterium]